MNSKAQDDDDDDEDLPFAEFGTVRRSIQYPFQFPKAVHWSERISRKCNCNGFRRFR